MFGMLSNYQNTISKSSLLQQSKGALQDAFLEHLKSAKSLTQKSHKACEKFPAQTKMACPPQKQLRLGHSFALGSFSQNKYEDKVNGNYY